MFFFPLLRCKNPGGGSKGFFIVTLPGEMIQFDKKHFSNGLVKNHQLETVWSTWSVVYILHVIETEILVG